MELRFLRAEDIPAAAQLEVQCFSDPMPEDMIARLAFSDGYAALAAVGDGQHLLGWAALQLVLDEASLLTIASSPDCRRCGVGEALLREAMSLARARGAAFLTLEVRESNVPARALYEKLGFQCVGERKNYYEKPVENAILMTAYFRKEDDVPC